MAVRCRRLKACHRVGEPLQASSLLLAVVRASDSPPWVCGSVSRHRAIAKQSLRWLSVYRGLTAMAAAVAWLGLLGEPCSKANPMSGGLLRAPSTSIGFSVFCRVQVRPSLKVKAFVHVKSGFLTLRTYSLRGGCEHLCRHTVAPAVLAKDLGGRWCGFRLCCRQYPFCPA
jgi:hypothetical protein